MSRQKRLRNINGLNEILETIIKNQCSLSAIELNLLNEALAKLNKLKSKKGLTNKQYMVEISDIINLITLFLAKY